MEALRKFDTFRRLDADFQQGTYYGACMTIITWMLMIYLMLNEVWTMFDGDYTTEVRLDESSQEQVDINFDITMLDLPCKFAQLNLWDIFENYRLNVTGGIKQRNNLHWENGKLVPGSIPVHEDKKIKWDEIEVELDKEGHHAVDLKAVEGGKSIEEVWKEHADKYTVMLANFYANWCVWSKRLSPVFEKTAEKIDSMHWLHEETKVKLVKVDCAVYPIMCKVHRVRAFPSILLFVDGKLTQKYEEDRTVDAITSWVVKQARTFDQKLPNVFHDEACQLIGTVTVPRVPGNFIIQATKAEDFSVSPTMTNVSHRIGHFSFGPWISPKNLGLPWRSIYRWAPLNGEEFIVDALHKAPQHYINVVPNTYTKRGLFFGRSGKTISTFQISTANKMRTYHVTGIPEAQFTYKFASVVLDHANRGQGLYHVVTNLCAIIGGTYAVMELSNLLITQILRRGPGRMLVK